MVAELTGTLEKGALKLDGALPFPDHTRVRLRIEPIRDVVETHKAWLALLAKIDEHPIAGGGGPYSREDLYDRD